MKNALTNVTDSPISTIVGVLIAGLVAVQQASTQGHITWQMGCLIFAAAALGCLSSDLGKLHLGLVQKLIAKHGIEAVAAAVQEQQKVLAQQSAAAAASGGNK